MKSSEFVTRVFDCYFLDRTSVVRCLPFPTEWGRLQCSRTRILRAQVARGSDERCAAPSPSLPLKCCFVLLSFCKLEGYLCLKIVIFPETLCVFWNSLFFQYTLKKNNPFCPQPARDVQLLLLRPRVPLRLVINTFVSHYILNSVSPGGRLTEEAQCAVQMSRAKPVGGGHCREVDQAAFKGPGPCGRCRAPPHRGRNGRNQAFWLRISWRHKTVTLSLCVSISPWKAVLEDIHFISRSDFFNWFYFYFVGRLNVAESLSTKILRPRD